MNREIEEYLEEICRNIRISNDEMDEVKQELRCHLLDKIRELEANGIEKGECIKMAQKKFGNPNIIGKGIAKAKSSMGKKLILLVAAVAVVVGLSILQIRTTNAKDTSDFVMPIMMACWSALSLGIFGCCIWAFVKSRRVSFLLFLIAMGILPLLSIPIARLAEPNTMAMWIGAIKVIKESLILFGIYLLSRLILAQQGSREKKSEAIVDFFPDEEMS